MPSAGLAKAALRTAELRWDSRGILVGRLVFSFTHNVLPVSSHLYNGIIMASISGLLEVNGIVDAEPLAWCLLHSMHSIKAAS